MNYRWILKVLFVSYFLFIVWSTLLTRTAKATHSADLRFMWAYREMVTGDPNWKNDVLQNLQNILFLVPFGMLFPVKKWKTVLISAVVFSVLIEAAQYIFGLGLCELDDVICNALGAMIGFWIVMGLMKAVRIIDET